MSRMFVAAIPPAEVIEDLDDFLVVRRQAADFRWTLPEQWHLTLAFMADVSERALDDLTARLTRAAAKRRPMRLRVAGGGAFPNAGRARVLFADVLASAEDRTELSRLATGARAAAAKSGAGVDGARFRAHLTLARIGRPTETTNWIRLLDGYRGPSWRLDQISLVASYLGEGPRKRPRHEVVAGFALGAAR